MVGIKTKTKTKTKMKKTTMGFSICERHRRFLEQWGYGRMSKALYDIIEYYMRPQDSALWVQSTIKDYRMGLINEEQALDAYISMKEQAKYFEDSGLVKELRKVLGI